MTFTAERAAAPIDLIGKDIKITCGMESEYAWMVKPEGTTGKWKFKTNDDCTVYEEPKVEPKNDDNGGDSTTEEKTGAMKTFSTMAAATLATSVIASLY